jgi:hypothetical protein
MAAKPINPDTVSKIDAEWRTGEYSQRDLADRHGVSAGKVAQITKGVPKDAAHIVSAGIQYRQGLAGQDERMVSAVTEAVDERTKHIQFFTNAAVINVKQAMAEPCEGQMGYRMRAETILKGKETVLGKSPDTAIQINNTALPRTINVIAGRS